MLNIISQGSARAVAPLDLVVRLDHVEGDVYDVTVRIGNEASANSGPAATVVGTGPVFGSAGLEYEFESTATDPDEDDLYYQWDWGDGRSLSDWMGPYASGETCIASHTWPVGDFDILVRVKDDFGVESDWSTAHSIHLQCCLHRGDVDHSGVLPIDIADLVYLVDYMFSQGSEPECFDEADLDATGVEPIDIADLIYLVDFMFVSGSEPTACPSGID